MNSKLPRVSVDKSNQYFFAQLVDVHQGGKVIVAIHEKTFESAEAKKMKPVERAGAMGEAFGKLAKEAGVTAVAFDRSGYIYHGKVKAFAEGMRKAGLTL